MNSTPNADYSSWISQGEQIAEYQTLTDFANDVYGKDDAYDVEGNIFSNGTVLKSEVNDTIMRSETLSFTYTGDAFDLVSACGKDTGIQIVTVRNTKDKSVEKIYIVDTYYTDTTYVNENGLLCQVPIIHHVNGAHGTYNVEVTSAYLAYAIGQRSTMSLRSDGDMVDFYTADISDEAIEAILSFAEMEDLLGEDIEVVFADENSVFNGGTGAASSAVAGYALGSSNSGVTTLVNYIDGFRIYNPMGEMDGYYPLSETDNVYYNVINDVTNLSLGETTDLKGIVYLTGETAEKVTFAEYQQKGPKNEVYLTAAGTEALAFGVGYQPGCTVSVGMRSVNGKPVTVKINGKTITVTSSTEMYYDISDAAFSAIGSIGLPLVTIQNISDNGALLAVNNLKFATATMTTLSYSMLPTMRALMAMPVEEDVPEEEIVPPTNPNPGTGNDPDLDVEGSIPDYVPDVNENESESSDATTSFIDSITKFFDSIKAFFDKILSFINSLFA